MDGHGLTMILLEVIDACSEDVSDNRDNHISEYAGWIT